MTSKTVLMCGGPADGRWVAVEPGQQEWVCIVPVQVAVLAPDSDDYAGPQHVRYMITLTQMFGEPMWVGVTSDDMRDRDRTIMRAVLQRDVATHLGAYR